jgi:hypothetical protein
VYGEEIAPTFLLVLGLAGGVGRITTQHLFILADPDSLPLDDLKVLQAAQNLVVYLENALDAESGTLLDGEWLVLESLKRALGGKFDDYIWTSLDLESEGFDDALSGVVRVSNGLTGVEAQ